MVFDSCSSILRFLVLGLWELTGTFKEAQISARCSQLSDLLNATPEQIFPDQGGCVFLADLAATFMTFIVAAEALNIRSLCAKNYNPSPSTRVPCALSKLCVPSVVSSSAYRAASGAFLLATMPAVSVTNRKLCWFYLIVEELPVILNIVPEGS